MATDGQPVVPTQGQPVVLRSTDESHTGIVCENMQGLGAKLRKLPRQAKICTPPGGDACPVSCLDMSGHVQTCPDMSGHGGHRGALHAKIYSGDLSGSGLRKYALRQNHTIPV